jgi:diguanylate cyclase (GGDEF)-like protein
LADRGYAITHFFSLSLWSGLARHGALLQGYMNLHRTFLFLSLLLAFTMIVMAADRLVLVWQGVSQAHKGRDAVLLLQDTLTAAEMASRERGPANALLGAEKSDYPLRKANLNLARAKTDAAFSALDQRLAASKLQGSPAHLAYLQAAADLYLGRMNVDAILGSRNGDAIRLAIEQMFSVITAFEPGLMALANEAQVAIPSATDELLGAILAARLRENAGKLGSQFTVALTTQQPIRALEHDDIQQLRGRIDQLREVLLWRISVLTEHEEIRSARDTLMARYFNSALPFTESIEAASQARRPYALDTASFAAAYVADMESIVQMRDALMQRAIEASVHEVGKRMDEAVRLIGVTLLMIVVLGSTLWLLHARVVKPLSQSTELIVAISQGQLEQKIPASLFRDEIEDLFRAIGVLQESSRTRVALEKERFELIAQLRAQSNTDYLTGLPNRRGFYELAEHDLPNLQRQGYPLTLAIFDIDHFKKVNDKYGHAVGDHVLVEVARVCQSALRRGDVVARFGGEEFVLWLPYCALEQGLARVETLRQDLAGMQIVVAQGARIEITASFGLLTWSGEFKTIDQAISKADELLYAAKSNGRNCVMSA